MAELHGGTFESDTAQKGSTQHSNTKKRTQWSPQIVHTLHMDTQKPRTMVAVTTPRVQNWQQRPCSLRLQYCLYYTPNHRTYDTHTRCAKPRADAIPP
jgi:hypothetical protein